MISEAGFVAVEDPSRAVRIVSTIYHFKKVLAGRVPV
jgi:hypothetical protein